MNTVLSNYGQLCGCPEILKKSCKFFCRGLDIRVMQAVRSKLMISPYIQVKIMRMRCLQSMVTNLSL